MSATGQLTKRLSLRAVNAARTRIPGRGFGEKSHVQRRNPHGAATI
ncbi:hypothetical protein FTUN_4486 [Frigoriglobus tundricola]|uniref:Uncharacterized protein n=1 Tax=Frigoriglobus tundricola TaxID=2774151 RepID=A0A6M5YU31_9BACT|nr:hypothetical protein FTUN_4486 [Frigoriglobus tundricola]